MDMYIVQFPFFFLFYALNTVDTILNNYNKNSLKENKNSKIKFMNRRLEVYLRMVSGSEKFDIPVKKIKLLEFLSLRIEKGVNKGG